MASFEYAKTVLAAVEGGYSNDPTDLGGETNFGISKRSYPNVDIKNLTLEKAQAIYKKDFWDANKLSDLSNQLLANQVLDMLVNEGDHGGAIVFQKAISNCGKRILIDANIGPVTISLANSIPWDRLMDAIRVERVRAYLKIVDGKPNQLVKLRSWLRRAVA